MRLTWSLRVICGLICLCADGLKAKEHCLCYNGDWKMRFDNEGLNMKSSLKSLIL